MLLGQEPLVIPFCGLIRTCQLAANLCAISHTDRHTGQRDRFSRLRTVAGVCEGSSVRQLTDDRAGSFPRQPARLFKQIRMDKPTLFL